MKKPLFIFLLFFVCLFTYGQSEQQINNLTTFSKLYGNVKYFHPSDEASDIDWNKFAVYGCKMVEHAKNTDELLVMLDSLFKPIAPTIQLMKTGNKIEFDVKTISPNNIKGYETIAWQHLGNGIEYPLHHIYKSIRVNKDRFIDKGSNSHGAITKTINAEKYRDKQIKLSGYIKINPYTKGKGKFWLSIKKESVSNEEIGDSIIKIKNTSWKQYKITANLGKDEKYISFGASLLGKGELFVDDIQLFYEEGNQWIEIPFANNDFETQTWSNKKNSWNNFGKGYSFTYTDKEFNSGSSSLSVKYVGVLSKNYKLFDKYPKIGETIKEDIGSDIYLILPIALYGNKKATYPKSDKEHLLKLKNELTKINLDSIKDVNNRTADVIITWNIFQHFYPYFDVIKTDWNKELMNALQNCYLCKTEADFLMLLRRYTSTLNDGHLKVYNFTKKEYWNIDNYQPPIEWEWIENKLVITYVWSDSIKLKVGDIVVKINRQNPKDYFDIVGKYLSAATEGYKNFLLNYYSLSGEKDSRISLMLQNGDSIQLFRTKKLYSSYKDFINYKLYENDIVYLNLNTISMSQIDSLLPTLTTAKSIICDLRFYPNDNNDFISYLLEKPDTATHFCQTPEIIYPDNKNNGYKYEGNKLPAKKPHLKAKIIFIIDGSAISWAETYLNYIDGYKLAILVGQPTAGTDGLVQSFKLPGGFDICYTGEKVVKLNGTQLFGVGVLPDVYVNKTIKGVIEGRDEFLDKALEIANMK